VHLREELSDVLLYLVRSSSSLLLSSLELSDTKVYEPYVRALLGTAAQVLLYLVRSHSYDVLLYLAPLPSQVRGLTHTRTFSGRFYRGTSLIRNSPPLGFYGSRCLGPYAGPREVGVSYERGTPVTQNRLG